MALMTEKRIRHLPVVDDGNVIGIISLAPRSRTSSPRSGS
jgi:CBS domain-containing protein